MTDPFRQFFIESLQATLRLPASEESLQALFKYVRPTLSLEELYSMTPKEQSKMIKVLKSRIHPDKHPHNTEVTELFQEVQNFYEECLKYMTDTPRKRNKRPRSDQIAVNRAYPQSFCCFEKWPHMKESLMVEVDAKTVHLSKREYPPIPLDGMLKKEEIPIYQAFKCIHARGAVVHGKAIKKYTSFEMIKNMAKQNRTVADIFQESGGLRHLDSIEAIKVELMNCGPVISTSFELTKAYFDQLNKNQKSFVKEAINSTHELLITGWCLTPYGEAWQVQPILEEGNTQSIAIGFGQFGIDYEVVVPDSSLDHISWELGPYFDYDFSDIEDWRSWEEMNLPIREEELKTFASCFENGLMSGESFVLRDSNKFAHSCTYKVRNIEWSNENNEWTIQIYKDI